MLGKWVIGSDCRPSGLDWVSGRLVMVVTHLDCTPLPPTPSPGMRWCVGVILAWTTLDSWTSTHPHTVSTVLYIWLNYCHVILLCIMRQQVPQWNFSWYNSEVIEVFERSYSSLLWWILSWLPSGRCAACTSRWLLSWNTSPSHLILTRLPVPPTQLTWVAHLSWARVLCTLSGGSTLRHTSLAYYAGHTSLAYLTGWRILTWISFMLEYLTNYLIKVL